MWRRCGKKTALGVLFVVSVCVCDYFLKTNKNKHRERVKAEEKFIWSFVVLVRDDCCWW